MLFLSTGISFADYTISVVYSNPGDSLLVADTENNQIAFVKYEDFNLSGIRKFFCMMVMMMLHADNF